jgi:hypothetical protein
VNIGIFLKIEDCEGGVILYAGSSFIRVNMVFGNKFLNLKFCLFLLLAESVESHIYDIKNKHFYISSTFKFLIEFLKNIPNCLFLALRVY